MKPAPEPELVDCGPKATEADVAGVERFLGTRLPPAYRAFLLQYNGGKPRRSSFPLPSHEDGSIDVELFFGVSRDEPEGNLEWNYKQHRKVLGKTMLPIGRSVANDLIALVLSGDKRHGIVFYDAIEEDPEARLHAVADDFASFLASMKEE